MWYNRLKVFVMEIKNKIESIKYISEMGLNKFPEELFKRGEEEKVKKFLEKYPAKFYAIRDKAKHNGVFKLDVERDKILEEIQEYELFTINVCSGNYPNSQMLTGDVKITTDNLVYVTLSTNPNDSVRSAYIHPSFNFCTDIFDKRLDEIPDFDYIYEYIYKHNLTDMVVEFALFNINVGIKNERIIIFELRTNY